MAIIDTNIIIELFKGNIETKNLLESINEDDFCILILYSFSI